MTYTITLTRTFEQEISVTAHSADTTFNVVDSILDQTALLRVTRQDKIDMIMTARDANSDLDDMDDYDDAENETEWHNFVEAVIAKHLSTMNATASNPAQTKTPTEWE